MEKLASKESPLVLVVDDEDSIRLSLSRVLEDEGYRVIVAADGEEAVEKVASEKPEVVFLDIWMPGWDGIQTLEKIKEIEPEAAVIMISGHATISNALEANKRGAFDFIEKPLNIESIVHAVSRALNQSPVQHLAASDVTQHSSSTSVSANRETHRVLSSILAENEMLATGTLSHTGMQSTGLRGKNVGQRTIKQSVILYGQCLHSGQKSGLVLEPLPANSGIHFAKIGDTKTIPAFVDYVESTGFATTIRAEGVSAATIEHLLSVLHAYRISNLLIKCNDEVPIFDGSAKEFCRVIESVGI